MKLYADLPGRRTAQILSDLFALGWVVLWVWAGRLVRDATLDLRKPAEGLTSAGGSFSQNMSGASEQLQRVPGIGDDLARPFTSASGTGQQLAQAGRDLGVAVDRLALVLGILIAAIPILVVCGRCGCVSCGGPQPPSGSSTRTRTLTSSPCEQWLVSRCTSWPRSRTTPRGPGVGATR